jgi:hypothetical protein
MHVGLVVDEERLLHEHIVLNRLTIGLIDQGASLTRFVPQKPPIEGFADLEQRVALVAQRVEVPMHLPRWLHRIRTRQLAAGLEKTVPDVLYAAGRDAWTVARELAAAVERPVALDVWSAELVRAVPRGRAAQVVAAYVAPTEPIGDLLRDRVDPGLVSVIPPGVGVAREPREVFAEPDRAISVAIFGGCRDVSSYTAMLAGLAGLVREVPQLQAAIELRGPRAHAIWREAQRLGLLTNLSAIRDAAPLRPLLTRCDVLIMPERFGEMRTLILEAMASQMAIITAADPFLDMLDDGQTVAVVPEDTPEAWSRQLRRVLLDPELARGLGRRAREHVLTRHRSSDHVVALLALLEQIVSGGAYAFSRPDGLAG